MKARSETAILEEETTRWAARIKESMNGVKAVKGKEYLVKNIEAYISDSSYFRKKGDMVRSFEAIIWAWAWLEIGLAEGLVGKNQK